MTTSNRASGYEAGPPTADDLRAVHFTPASMLHPGYTDREVDDFVARAADELARLTEENSRLREQVQDLQQQVDAAAARPSPSDQAVGILATAQLTADQYVAEAEEFSRQMTSEARSQYEEQVSTAREKAGAIIQAAQEARAAIVAAGGGRGGEGVPDTQELQDQVAYLKAFAQACRVQLRSYLEALLSDVETEWGRAHPAVVPPQLVAPRDEQGALTFHSNAAAEEPATGNGGPGGATAAPAAAPVAATRAPA
jgi:DivIVA domain-containing protein